MTLAAYITAIGVDVPAAPSALSTNQKTVAVQRATAVYSAMHPRKIYEDLEREGETAINLEDLTSWDSTSQVFSVEYPVQTGFQKYFLELGNDFYRYEHPEDGPQLVFVIAIEDGATLRIGYTAPHSVTSSVSTIPARHDAAFKSLCAAEFCDLCAAWHAESAATTMNADSVQHSVQAQAYAASAKTFRAAAMTVLGRKQAASANINWEHPAHRVLPLMTHRDR